MAGTLVLPATKTVLTIPTTDGEIVHVTVADEAAALALMHTIASETGENGAFRVDVVPATWECDGRDDCTVAG